MMPPNDALERTVPFGAVGRRNGGGASCARFGDCRRWTRGMRPVYCMSS